MGPRKVTPRRSLLRGGKVIAPECTRESVPRSRQGARRSQASKIPKRRESDDKIAVALVKSVSQWGCVSQDSDALVSQGRESR